MRGTVDSVRIVYLGAYLAADAALAATSLVVDSVLDFSETGGTLRLNGVSYTYTAADFATATLTLATGLTAAAVSGTRVDVMPLTPEKQALVMMSGAEDVLTARVPHALYDRMPEGIRDAATAESVTFADFGPGGGELVISDVVGKAPVIDAAYIDQATLPPNPSDGLAPSAAPAALLVQGGPGMLFASWTAVTNADPVSYEVHVSKTNNFTATAATLLATTTATSYTIKKLPGAIPTPPAVDTTALVYYSGGVRQVYYVKVRAVDADGAGPYSAQASGSLVQVANADITANSITTPKIGVGQITGDLFAAQILLASLIKTANSGQRWEGDNSGIRLFDQTGSVSVNLPTGSGEVAKFAGEGEFDSLTVNDKLSVGGVANAIATNGGVALDSGITKPAGAPTRTVEWESIQLDVTTPRAPTSGPNLFGTRAPDATNFNHILIEGTTILWVVEQFVTDPNGVNDGSRIWKYDLTTGAHSECYDWENYVTSLTKMGSTYYVMWTQTWNFWYVTTAATVPSEVGAWIGRYVTNISTSSLRDVVIGNNTTSLLLADVEDATGKLWFRAFTLPGSPGDVTITSNAIGDASVSFTGSDYRPNFLLYGTFDFGANRYVTAAANTGYNYHTATVANPAVWQPNEEWPSPTSDKRGTGWDGTRFWTLGTDGRLYKHSTITWTTESPNWWIGHTWNDSVGTVHETDLGTMGLVVAKKRARVRVSIPRLAGSGGTDEPDGWKVYWNRSASQPASTTMKLQATVSGGTLSYYIDTLNTAGAAPPLTNNFPGGSAPGYARAAALDAGGNPKVDIRGDGYAYLAEPRIPLLTADVSRTTRPRAYIYSTLARSIPSSILTAVQFDTSLMVDGITCPAGSDTFTVVTPGWYLTIFNGLWADTAVGANNGVALFRDGVELIRTVGSSQSYLGRWTAGQVASFQVIHARGVGVNLNVGTNAWMQWEGPL